MKWGGTCVDFSPAQHQDVDRLSRKWSQAPRSKHTYKDLCNRASIQNPSAWTLQPTTKLNFLTLVSTYTLLQLSSEILAEDGSCAEVWNMCCWGRQQKPVCNLRCPCSSHSLMPVTSASAHSMRVEQAMEMCWEEARNRKRQAC